MSKLRIAVYTMAKNEIDHVSRYAEVTQDADAVIVTDTGSTDGTAEALADAGITVANAQVLPWRFDVATNCALAHVPADIDVCIKLDLDEVLFCHEGHWRDEIERMWADDVHQLEYWYTWNWLVKGEKPGVRFRTSNIHARQNFHWLHPAHSVLHPTSAGRKVRTENIEIHHYMTGKKRPDYLSLLQQAVKENRCPRTLYYLGREYAMRKMWLDAKESLLAYLEHPNAKWKAERAGANCLLGESLRQLGDNGQALQHYLTANTECPNTRDVWWEISNFFTATNDIIGATWATNQCLACQARNPEWVWHHANAWTNKPQARYDQLVLTVPELL